MVLEPPERATRPTGVQRCVVTLVLMLLMAACADERAEDVVAPPAVSASPSAALLPLRTGPVGDDGAAASCVEAYNVTTIGNRSFAFDGTITAIGPGRTDRADMGQLDTAGVTFRVNEWFTGGTGETVTVDLMSPSSSISGDDTPAYEEGTRLLVSGEPRWGGDALDDAVAWSCGGFTRYYEPAVADEWRAGTA